MAQIPEWSRIVNTTIHKFIREEEVNILRGRKVLAMLQDRGRISFDNSGDLLDWKVRYKRSPMQGYADSDTLTFSRRDRWKTAQLDWRGYSATDSETKMERLKNKSMEAIINIYSQIAQSLIDDMDDQFGDEFYVDGNAAGNLKRIHGIESAFAGATSNAGNFVGTNAATYAGLNTTLATYGGSWTGTWPTGTGDAHYDFWSPLILDYTNTGWSAATKTWPNTCKEVLRYGVVKSTRNKNKKGRLDMFLLDIELFRQFKNALDAEERVVVSKGEGEKGLVALGWPETVNFEGVDVSSEYGIPANLGYGWSVENVELMSMQPTLFAPDGPDFDIASKSWRFSIDFFGNLKMNPRPQMKLWNLS